MANMADSLKLLIATSELKGFSEYIMDGESQRPFFDHTSKVRR
jgi:hypothetical protein